MEFGALLNLNTDKLSLYRNASRNLDLNPIILVKKCFYWLNKHILNIFVLVNFVLSVKYV